MSSPTSLSYMGQQLSPVSQSSPTKAQLTMTNKYEMSPMQKQNACQRQLDYVMRELERFKHFVHDEQPSQLAARSNPADQALADMKLAHARQLYADYYGLIKEYVAHGGNPAPYELKASELYFESAAYLMARERRTPLTASMRTPPRQQQTARDHINDLKNVFDDMMKRVHFS